MIRSLVVLLFLSMLPLSSFAALAPEYVVAKNSDSLSLSDINALWSKALQIEGPVKELFNKVASEQECYITEEGFIVHCEIERLVDQRRFMTLEYLSGFNHVGLYRAFFMVFHQGTQMWNKVVIQADFRFSENVGEKSFRLEIVGAQATN